MLCVWWHTPCNSHIQNTQWQIKRCECIYDWVTDIKVFVSHLPIWDTLRPKKNWRVGLSVTSQSELLRHSLRALLNYKTFRGISDKDACWLSSVRYGGYSEGGKLFHVKLFSKKLKLCRNENWTIEAQICVLSIFQPFTQNVSFPLKVE